MSAPHEEAASTAPEAPLLPGSTPLPPVAKVVVPFEPIAIVGVGLRAPGGIDSLSSLWDTIIQRQSHHACFATDPRALRRFNMDDFEPLFALLPNGRETLHANLLDETPGLDEVYFGVNKPDSACMEAQLKLLLHVAHEALEDAGFSGQADVSALDPATFGVYIGAAADQFCQELSSYSIDMYHLVRNQRAFLSGQISHHFGLHGPSVSVDTACASSMTAFNDACRALVTGECRAAIAGGVHVMSPVSAPAGVLSLKLAGLLEPNGQCKPFLATGNGYCSSEACGLAVLKRLSDAVRDGDRIHGVIQGMGTGNMSSNSSILRPDGRLESAVLAKAVASSGIDPADISFVEAHGPGTQQGDPAELFSICSVLAQPGSRCQTNSLVIGSVKGNVGHSESASGAISLFKVLAMMRHRRIPPQAGFHPSKLNPNLHTFFDKHPIRMSDSEQEWSAPRRIAVVSNLGATGYAGYMVVEDPSSCVPSADTSEMNDTPLPFMISAKDSSTLRTLARSYADWIDGTGMSVPLSDVSYSTTTRRMAQPHFALVRAKSHAELAQQLRRDTLPIVDASSIRRRTLAFCFSGLGGPRLDPRQSSLYGMSAAFSSAVNTCFQLAEHERLIAPDDIEVLELFALQVGLAQMWTSWGVTPVALAGHSFGEYVTLVCAGVLTLRDALKLLGIVFSLVRENCVGNLGEMAALGLPLSDVRELLRQQQTTKVELACINSEDRVTLAGTPEDLRAFHKEILKVHPTARWHLIENMRAAFHSCSVEPLCQEFSRACKDIKFHLSNAVVLSGPLGRICFPGDEALLQPDYLVRHCRETNLFGKAVLDYKRHNEIAGEYHPDWIELGPHSTTIGFIPPSSGQIKLPSHQKGGAGWTTTLDTLMTLRAAGHAIDFVAFHHDINPAARHTDLPRYPFRLQPHSYPVRKTTQASSASPHSVTYPRATSAELSSILKNHSVANRPTCPASVYIALVLAACGGGRNGSAFRLSRFKFGAPFTSLTDDWLQARAFFSSPKEGASTFDVISKNGQVHASLQVEIYEEAVLLNSLSLLKPLVSSLQSVKTLSGTNILDTRLAYDLWSQTVHYGPHFRGLRRVWIPEDGQQAWALFSNEPEQVAHRLALEPAILRNFSPILIDQACQLIDLLINTSRARCRDEIFVISEIDQVEFAPSSFHDSVSFESYASFELANGHGTADTAVGQVFTFDQEQRLVAVFRGVTMRRVKLPGVPVVPPVLTTTFGTTENLNPAVGPVFTQRPSTPPFIPKEQDEESPNNQLRKQVSAIVQTTLGIDHIPPDRKLAELGLDSLCAVEIGVELGRLLPDRKLPGELLAKANTTLTMVYEALRLSCLEQRTSGTTAVDKLPSFNADAGPTSTTGMATSTPNAIDGTMAVLDYIGTNPELIQDKPGTPVLMLIHDSGGTALAYRLFGDVGCTILGIHSPGLRDGKGIVSIRHAANLYASLTRQWLDQSSRRRPRLLVGGWSLGGTIAIALAAAHPDLVSGVILLDPTPPGTTAMTLEEAERLVPAADTHTAGGFGTLVRTQLKINTLSLSVDSDQHGGYQALVAGLKAPVYLISAIQPLRGPGMMDMQPAPTGSCAAWMLRNDRASMAETAWKDTIGDILIGTQRTAGDHFTMFTHAHAASTTRAVQQAVGALEASLDITEAQGSG